MLQLGKSSYYLDLELPMLEEFGADVVPKFYTLDETRIVQRV